MVRIMKNVILAENWIHKYYHGNDLDILYIIKEAQKQAYEAGIGDKKEEITENKELLELIIKAGRRLSHDFDHLISDLPEGNLMKEVYRDRGKIWHSVFYPDNGAKNYRASLHSEIDNLEFRLNRAIRRLEENNLYISDLENNQF